MSTEQQQAIAAEVLSALESGQLELPTLPEIAVKVRDMIDDPNVSADKLVLLLSSDPVISAHIIKAANTAAASGGTQVDTLRGAVSRLGYRMLRNLVITVTMSKLFKADSPVINRQLIKLWEHSRNVAAYSYVIALHQKHLKPEQAMLAGLVHNLGALPLCIYADRHHPRLDLAELEELARKFSTRIGIELLQRWHFTDDLIEVVAAHENLQRDNGTDMADYVDVVTLANLQAAGTAKFVAWQNVSAASKLGFDEKGCLSFLESYAAQIDFAREMLGMQAKKAPPAPAAPVPAQQRSTPAKTKPANSGLLSKLLGFFK